MARGKDGAPRPRAKNAAQRYTGFWKKDKRGRWGNSERRAKELRRTAERKPVHPMVLRRCFQALRVAVNDERWAIKVCVCELYHGHVVAVMITPCLVLSTALPQRRV